MLGPWCPRLSSDSQGAMAIGFRSQRLTALGTLMGDLFLRVLIASGSSIWIVAAVSAHGRQHQLVSATAPELASSFMAFAFQHCEYSSSCAYDIWYMALGRSLCYRFWSLGVGTQIIKFGISPECFLHSSLSLALHQLLSSALALYPLPFFWLHPSSSFLLCLFSALSLVLSSYPLLLLPICFCFCHIPLWIIKIKSWPGKTTRRSFLLGFISSHLRPAEGVSSKLTILLT